MDTVEVDTSDQKTSSSWPKVMLGFLLLVSVALAVVIWFQFFSTPHASSDQQYTIAGVPHFSIHNHVGESSNLTDYISKGSASILEYWTPGRFDISVVQDNFNHHNDTGYSTFRNLVSYFNTLEVFNATVVTGSIDELKPYLSEESKTPLLTFLPVSTDQPDEVEHYPVVVIFGLDEVNETVTMHHYWFGNNHVVSIDEFRTLQEKLPLGLQNTYLAVEPKDRSSINSVLQNYSQDDYLARTTFMNQHDLVKNIAIGTDANRSNLHPIAEEILTEAIEHPEFEDQVPAVFKVFALYRLADSKLRLGKVDEAQALASRAVDLNTNLSVADGEWPGYEFPQSAAGADKISGPFRVLAGSHLLSGQFEEAAVAYQEALAVMPSNKQARAGLKFVEKILNTDRYDSTDTAEIIAKVTNGSPWLVRWSADDGVEGEHKITFTESSLDSSVFGGELFDFEPNEEIPTPLIKTGVYANCVYFRARQDSGISAQHDYCLTSEGKLVGVVSGHTATGEFFIGDTTAISQASTQ